MPDSNSERTNIRARLLADVQDKRLELPTLPESASRIDALTDQDTVSLRAFAKALAQDPGLACQVMRIANSAPYSSSQPVGTLTMAIKQLGIRYASELAAGLANRTVFQPTNEMIERRYRAAIFDATWVSAAAAVLARNYSEISPERARLAGLSHNLGAFPILAQAEYESFTDTFALETIVETVQVVLSSTILKRWSFPAAVAEIPIQIASYSRSDGSLSLLDLVAAAAELNRYFNHDSDDNPTMMPQSLSLLIYEIAGFDPLSNLEQVNHLRDEIELEREADS